MSNSIVKRIAEKLKGKKVYVEGTIAMLAPGGSGQVVYSPAQGLLVDVFDEGISIVLEGNDYEGYMFFANMRGIEPLKGASDLVMPKKTGLFTG